jgi:succinate dehydrogenase/fumarate reductase flavoprotein subunit
VCDYAILPTEYRLKIADRLETATKTMDHADTKKSILSHATDLRTEPFSPDQQKMYQRMFVRYNDQQDRFRKDKTWRELLPELEESLTKSIK